MKKDVPYDLQLPIYKYRVQTTDTQLADGNNMAPIYPDFGKGFRKTRRLKTCQEHIAPK